jgi:hypothetical protein
MGCVCQEPRPALVRVAVGGGQTYVRCPRCGASKTVGGVLPEDDWDLRTRLDLGATGQTGASPPGTRVGTIGFVAPVGRASYGATGATGASPRGFSGTAA